MIDPDRKQVHKQVTQDHRQSSRSGKVNPKNNKHSGKAQGAAQTVIDMIAGLQHDAGRGGQPHQAGERNQF
jgi:hypothetical protein